MKTHDIGRLFWHAVDLQPEAPLVHSADSYEIDWPYRQSRSYIFRIPLSRKAIVVGSWRESSGEEDAHLMGALQARPAGLFDAGGNLDQRYRRET